MVVLGLAAGTAALVAGGAIVGGTVFGAVGFAFGVVASLFWHHAFPAADVVFLIVGGNLVLNLGMLPRFAASINWRQAVPYMVGATLGMPFGLWALYSLDIRVIRIIVGVVIAAYCLFALFSYRFKPAGLARNAPPRADWAIGAIGGVIGGLCGLGPLVPGVWYGLRGLDKERQRALSQPFGLYVQSVMLLWFMFHGQPSSQAVAAFAIAAPLMLATSCGGLYLFNRVHVTTFQMSVASLAMLGGTFLAVHSW
jgi:uncharacterized membrane protein YfcA